MAREISDLVVRLEGLRIREMLDGLPVARQLPVRKFAEDEIIFREGEEGASAFLVLDGNVLIEKAGPGGAPRQLARLGEGDVFGEMALLDMPVRSASSRAGAGGVQVLEIGQAQLDQICADTPQVARWLLKVLSYRLRVATKMTAEMEQIQKINRRIIDGQEAERRRIARDIHDGPAQQFADYMMRLQILKKLLDRDPEQAKAEADGLRASLEEGLTTLRKVIHNLHVTDTRSSGLETALRRFVDRMSADVGFQVEFALDAELADELADHMRTTVYCLVQEALNNIRKHAKARRVDVRLHPVGDGQFVLEVQDDGVGFDVDALLASYHQRESLGMTSMKERCELAGGTMTVRSESGAGTTVGFTFPRVGGSKNRKEQA
jgi:signal transduction histidine kinase